MRCAEVLNERVIYYTYQSHLEDRERESSHLFYSCWATLPSDRVCTCSAPRRRTGLDHRERKPSSSASPDRRSWSSANERQTFYNIYIHI